MDEERIYAALARDCNDFLNFYQRIVGYFHTFFFYHDVLPTGGPSRHTLRMRGNVLASIAFRYRVLALLAGTGSFAGAAAGTTGIVSLSADGQSLTTRQPSESEVALDESLHELFVTGLAGGDPDTLPAAIVAEFEHRIAVAAPILDLINSRSLFLPNDYGVPAEDEDASIRRVCAVWHEFNHAIGGLCRRVADICHHTGFDVHHLANPLGLEVDLSQISGVGGSGSGSGGNGSGGSGAYADAA